MTLTTIWKKSFLILLSKVRSILSSFKIIRHSVKSKLLTLSKKITEKLSHTTEKKTLAYTINFYLQIFANKRLIKPLLVVRVETKVRLHLRGTGYKFQIWQSLDRIANCDMKKKKKRNRTKKLTRGTTSIKQNFNETGIVLTSILFKFLHPAKLVIPPSHCSVFNIHNQQKQHVGNLVWL